MSKVMTKSKKSVPAGQKDNFSVTYTQFASNELELEAGEGKRFENDELLKRLGFEKDEAGVLKLPAASHEFEIDGNGEIIRKTDKKVLTGSEKEEATR